MDVGKVLEAVVDDESVRSYSSECLDLLDEMDQRTPKDGSSPESKVLCFAAEKQHCTPAVFTVSKIHDMLFDSSTDEFITGESSSESDSDYDLSDPEAEMGRGGAIVQNKMDDDNGMFDDITGGTIEDDTRKDVCTNEDICTDDVRVDEDVFCVCSDGDNVTSECDDSTDNSVTNDDDESSEDLTLQIPRGRGCGVSTSRGHGRSPRRGCITSTRRGRGRSTGKGRGKGGFGIHGTSSKTFQTFELCDTDNNVPKTFDFKPSRSVGAYLPSQCDLSPADLFMLFFDSGIVQDLCDATNEYAEAHKTSRPTMYKYFKPMCPADFYALIGIFVHLGYRRIPRYRLMWAQTSLCYDPIISKVFSRNRFESYLSFLHVVDSATEKTLKSTGDKLCKVRPLNDHLEKRSRELYQPHREISIDERMVRSKARFSFRQYIRNKPVKWGFKLWCLCDSHNGYTLTFSVYRGKNGEVRSTNGLGYDVVSSLMQEYLSQGYFLYIDNFYTSPTLVSDMYKLGVHVTGTLDCSRQGVPFEIADMKKKLAKKSVKRGDGIYVRDGVLVYDVWKDTKCVTVMSSEHPGHSETTVSRNFKNNAGVNEKKDVPIPIVIYNYNRFMNGVDRSDQLIKYYNVLRQTHKYWKTLFFHFIDIAIVNSYILYKEVHLSGKLSHFDFRETLVRQLCRIEMPTQQSFAGRKADPILQHVSVRMHKGKDCVYCKVVSGVRRRTTRKCSKCEAPLCFIARNCFERFHYSNFMKERNEWLEKQQISPSSVKPLGRPKGSTKPKGRGKRRRKNW